MKKYKIIAICGESGSGKDSIQKWITETYPKRFKGIVSTTTRPKRDNETDGVDYHFTDNVNFAKKVLDLSMLEATEFNGWFYGTSIDELDKDKINVGVFNPSGIETLLDDNRLKVYPIYIKALPKTRLLRCLNREKNPNCDEICRRYFADKKDFAQMEFEPDFIWDNSRDFKNNKEKEKCWKTRLRLFMRFTGLDNID